MYNQNTVEQDCKANCIASPTAAIKHNYNIV